MTYDAVAPDHPARPASAYLTYNGDRRHLVTDGTVLGPNMYGEACYPVTAEYDALADKTRVGISNIGPRPPMDDVIGT